MSEFGDVVLRFMVLLLMVVGYGWKLKFGCCGGGRGVVGDI